MASTNSSLFRFLSERPCPAAPPPHPVTESQPSSVKLRSAGNALYCAHALPVSAAHADSDSTATAGCRCPTSRSVSSEAVGTPDRVMEVRAFSTARWGRDMAENRSDGRMTAVRAFSIANVQTGRGDVAGPEGVD